MEKAQGTRTSNGMLEGITVVDLTTGVAGPHATKLLGGFGAEVIKVETPRGGDPVRSWGPFPGDLPHREKSGIFLHLNLNKRGITLDPHRATGRKILHDLLRHADILVEGLSPRDRSAIGLEHSSVSQVNPRLVHTSVTPFGTTGPYRDYDATDIMVYAMGGQMVSQGAPDREPINLAPNVVLYTVGLHVAMATLGAFYAVEFLGKGQHVDVAMVEALSSSADGRTNALVGYQFTGEETIRTHEGSRNYPVGIYPCADGYVFFQAAGRWPAVVKMIEMPELLNDPRFCTPDAQARPGTREEFEAIFLPWLMGHGKHEIWRIGLEAGLVVAPLNTTLDVLDDPHFRAVGAWTSTDHPALGRVKVLGRPAVVEHMPWQVCCPAPLLGQHNVEVLGRLGYGRQDLVKLRAAGVI